MVRIFGGIYQGVQPTSRLRKWVKHLVWQCEKESDVAYLTSTS